MADIDAVYARHAELWLCALTIGEGGKRIGILALRYQPYDDNELFKKNTCKPGISSKIQKHSNAEQVVTVELIH